MTAGLGIDRLIDLLIDTFWWFVPFFVIDHFERAVVLQFGRLNRVVGAGFHWMWPLGIEEVLSANIKPDGSFTKTQTITLKDGTSLTFCLILVWEISDIRKLILEVEDKETVLVWAQGTVEEFLHRTTYAELLEMRAWASESGKRHGLSEQLIRFVNDNHEERTGVHFVDIRLLDFCRNSLRDGVVRVLQGV